MHRGWIARTRWPGTSCGDEQRACCGKSELGQFGQVGKVGFFQVDHARLAEGLFVMGYWVEFDGVVILAVRGERRAARFVDIGTDSRPPHGVGDSLHLLPLVPVPDLELLSEAGGYADEGGGLGEDGVGADEVLAGARLDLHVKGHLDVDETFVGCEVPDFDVELPVATG